MVAQPADVWQLVAEMGQLVTEAVGAALAALGAGDVQSAEMVVAADQAIDLLEERVERICLEVLGAQRHRGAAEGQVRRVAAAFKVVTDLERIGDHAAAVARTTIRMRGERPIPPFLDIERLAALAQALLGDALTALGSGDAAAARDVAARDDGVDALYDQVFRELLTYMLDDRSAVRAATHLLFVASALERIADHATNLCEWVIFMDTGRRVELND